MGKPLMQEEREQPRHFDALKMKKNRQNHVAGKWNYGECFFIHLILQRLLTHAKNHLLDTHTIFLHAYLRS